MARAPVKGTIDIDGKPFHIATDSFKDKDIVDFSPRATIPGGGIIYSDMSLYQPIAFLDWSHGFGFIWHTDEAGYMYTEGEMDTRHAGLVTRFTDSTLSDPYTASNYRKNGGVIFPVDDYLYTWGENGVRRFDTSGTPDVWEDVPWSRVQFDAKTEGKGTGTGADAVTISHDPGRITDALVTVTLMLEGTATVQALTYGGTAMTLVKASAADGQSKRILVYGLCLGDIDGTAKDVSVDLSANTDWGYSIVTWEGAHQTIETAIPDAGITVVEEEAGVAEAEDTITVSDGCMTVYYVYKTDSSNDPARGSTTQQTSILNQVDSNGTTYSYDGSYDTPSAGDATEIQKYTWSGGNETSRSISFRIVPISASAEINFMYTNGQYLFIFPEGERPRYATAVSATPSAFDWTITGTNGRAVDYSSAVSYSGFTYCGKEDTGYVYSSSALDLSTLCGDPADDTTEIAVGAGDGILGLYGFASNLYASRYDGLWQLNTTDYVAQATLSYKNEYSTDNFRSVLSSGGYLYYTVRNKLYKWSGSTVTDITPQRLTDTFPYLTYGRFSNFVAHDSWLFYTARTDETTYSEAIIAYDGVGHHMLAEPISNGEGTISMMIFDPINNRLWYHVDNEQGDADDNNTYYIPVRAGSPYAYADFATTGTHQLVTSRIDAGFRRITKSMPTLWVETDACTTTSVIRVKYSLDGGSWVTWADISTNGITKLQWPGGLLTMEYEYLQLAFQFITTVAAVTPVLEGFTLMVMLRPDVLYGYSFDIIMGRDQTSGGFVDIRTADEILEDVKALRRSYSPVRMTTPSGKEVWGYLSSITDSLMELNEVAEGFRVDPEYVCSVSFIETLTLGMNDHA